MSEPPHRSRASLFLILIAAGVFFLGAALFPLLLRGQDAALNSAGIVLVPVVMNQAAPQLALTGPSGSVASLADYRGRVVLVNNWATWCPPCQAEMPDLQAYYQAHSAQGFVVVAIESGDSASNVANFVRQHGLAFPVWLDPQAAAVQAFKNWDLPSSYLVDRQGNLRLSWTGPLNPATLAKYVTPLLSEAAK